MDQTFDIGAVFSRAGRMLSQNAAPFAVLSLTLGLGSALLSRYTTLTLVTDAAGGIQLYGAFSAGLVGGLVMSIYMAFVISIAFQAETGTEVSVERALKRGLAAAVPLTVHFILFSLGITVGLVLLFIPGLILMCMWAVTLPALVGENAGIIGSFGRSRALTKGARWKIFGLFIVFIIISSVATAVLSLTGDLADPDPSLLTILLTSLSTVVTYLLYALFETAMFFELRESKEGRSQDQLREVFA